MQDEGYLKRCTEGPVGILTMKEPGPPARWANPSRMSFVYYIVISTAVAYVAGRTLAPGTDYLKVFPGGRHRRNARVRWRLLPSCDLVRAPLGAHAQRSRRCDRVRASDRWRCSAGCGRSRRARLLYRRRRSRRASSSVCLLARKGVRVVLLEAHDGLRSGLPRRHGAPVHARDARGDRPRGRRARDRSRQDVEAWVSSPKSGVDDARRLLGEPVCATRTSPCCPQDELLELLVARGEAVPELRSAHGRTRHRAGLENEGEEGRVCKASRLDDGSEVRATLTVGTDGRGSRISRLAGFEPVKNAPPMDVMWLRLPRRPGESARNDDGLPRR